MHCLHFMCCERGGCKSNDCERYAQLSPVLTGPNAGDRSRIASRIGQRSAFPNIGRYLEAMLMVRAIAGAAVAAAALSLLAATAAPAAPVRQHGPLAPSLAELAKPSVRALPPAQEARVLGVARSGPGSLIHRDGRVLVYVRHQDGAGTLPRLREEGGEVVAASRALDTATAAVSPSDLRAVAALPGVIAITPVRAPIL